MTGAAKKAGKKWLFYGCLIALPLLQFAIMYVGVNVNSFVMSFQRYDAVADSWTWAGMDNIKAVFTDIAHLPEYKYAFINSIAVWAVSFAINVPFGLLFAYYIYKRFVGWKFFRVILFLPSVISANVLVIMFKYYADAFLPNLINETLGTNIFGLLSQRKTEFITIVAFNVFIGFGINVLMYTGAMTGVSTSVIEAAQLDGANKLGEFFRIVLPQILGTVSVFVVTGVAGIFVNQLNLYSLYFDQAEPYLYTVGYYIYMNIQRAGTSYGVYPHFACLSMLVTLFVAPVVVFLRWLFRKIDPLEA